MSSTDPRERYYAGAPLPPTPLSLSLSFSCTRIRTHSQHGSPSTPGVTLIFSAAIAAVQREHIAPNKRYYLNENARCALFCVML
eukprot:546366-Pelagomonas_calceolata.AAC.3